MTPGWEAARRVLCVRLDALGDILMTTPAIRALRESRPGRHVTLLASPAGAVVAPLIPEIDEVIVYESPWMKACAARGSADDHAMIERLRAGRFDAAVVFTVYSQNPLPAALLCHLADIPLRLAHCRENPYHLLTDWVREREPHETVRHEVQRQLDLVAAVGCRASDARMSLRVDARARQKVRGLLRRAGVPSTSPFVVMHPGASAASRRYPPESFAEAARLIVSELGCSVVFTGAGPEASLVEAVRELMGDAASHSFAGLLSLGELAALIGLAPLLVSNNSGPVHLASALGTPVVDLYALTNPQHTPWMVPSRVLFHDVPCRYCYKSVCPEGHQDCLRRVEPGAVLEAARELLEGRRVAEAPRLPPLVTKRPVLPAPIQAGGGLA